MSRRAQTYLVAALLAAVLLAFVIYTQQQARIIRSNAQFIEDLYGRLYPVALSEGDSVDREQAIVSAWRALLGELGRLQIPVVVTDSLGNPTSWSFVGEYDRNNAEHMQELRRLVEELDSQREHLAFPGIEDLDNIEIHFGETLFLRQLRWIPFLTAAVLVLLIGGGAWLIFTSFRSERERIWSAMARESAHQMGTPLSSLVGWLEHLETERRPVAVGGEGVDIVEEMAADVGRLQKVSRRFELIGRKPKLEPLQVRSVVEHLRRYFQARLPTLGSEFEWAIDVPRDAPAVLGNDTLIEWAFENLLKNSIDAMAGRGGTIGVAYEGPNGKRSVYRVYDTGPGVAHDVRSKLFDIGVTTKERGWGVGLSLTRRIIEDMHGGAISLEDTPSGASFRVELPHV